MAADEDENGYHTRRSRGGSRKLLGTRTGALKDAGHEGSFFLAKEHKGVIRHDPRRQW